MSSSYAGIPSFLWGNRPSPASVTPGVLAFFSDVGENGTLMQATATRWRPMNGTASLKTMAAAGVSGIANSETIVLQASIPAGLLQVGDILRAWMTPTKNGATDAGNLTLRMGAAGTTSDTAITGLTAFQFMAASALAGGGIIDLRVISSTSVQKIGVNQAGNHAYQQPSGTTAAAAATTVTDMSTSPLVLSLALASAGATNTVGMTFAQIHLITP